jgi:hypothetical protein
VSLPAGALRCLDSIYAKNLPAGADAYLGYVDGAWPDFLAEVAKFPGAAHVIGMAVFPRDDAEGCDREPGDLAVGDIAAWVKRQIARGVWRPIVYASASNMDACMQALRAAGIARSAVRLLSAHYGAGKHICGPHSCGAVTVDMDGTQWRDDAVGVNGALVDESALLANFFGGTVSVTGPEKWDAADKAAFAAILNADRDFGAQATLWWLNNALRGTVTASMSPGQKADVKALHDAVASLIPAAQVLPSAEQIAAAVVADLPAGTPAEEAVIAGVKAALAQIFAPPPAP